MLSRTLRERLTTVLNFSFFFIFNRGARNNLSLAALIGSAFRALFRCCFGRGVLRERGRPRRFFGRLCGGILRLGKGCGLFFTPSLCRLRAIRLKRPVDSFDDSIAPSWTVRSYSVHIWMLGYFSRRVFSLSLAVFRSFSSVATTFT